MTVMTFEKNRKDRKSKGHPIGSGTTTVTLFNGRQTEYPRHVGEYLEYTYD